MYGKNWKFWKKKRIAMDQAPCTEKSKSDSRAALVRVRFVQSNTSYWLYGLFKRDGLKRYVQQSRSVGRLLPYRQRTISAGRDRNHYTLDWLRRTRGSSDEIFCYRFLMPFPYSPRCNWDWLLGFERTSRRNDFLATWHDRLNSHL